MRICQKLSARPDRLSIQKRLTYSNILMFLIPVAVTLISAFGALGVAFFAFERFCLPRMGLTLRGLMKWANSTKKI